ncbi:type II toxin-antitoxin system HipA family toxin [Desulfurispira natronophila]|uniref:Serine/threonine-protein kinase HipA n=1 Tax=Desulfurispira natronophila TaxID=682562 RepID=A0A7W8DHB9_9BACT|nr:type II toxin-antitoxin system HipA family toxin [Desulfurispira natronophila]MBB5022335.1 serine/threonine-protein kinase HipA [Desulfurispira natronophila]
MGRRKFTAAMAIFMNGERVGSLHRLSSGKLEMLYDEQWCQRTQNRSISLSLPAVNRRHSGAAVEHYFDNLLPDSLPIRTRIQAQFGLGRNDCFELLWHIGRDCIGAVQLLPEDALPPDVRKIEAVPIADEGIRSMLQNYQSQPLGMSSDGDFRISIAGAQEKTALLWHQGRWHRPYGATPTTHILKLPIGKLEHHGMDLSKSVENEWLCHLLLKAFGLPVANMQMNDFGGTSVLVVERFDRRWSQDGKNWIIRLPQEDMCQALGVPAALKYESHGGPGIEPIMHLLTGSANSMEGRSTFMKALFVFWLLGAIDGHAKNFSLFLRPGGTYRLTPLYDVISAYPLMASRQLPKQKVKMAMAVRGRSRHYEWNRIQLRHWLNTARYCQFSEETMAGIMAESLTRIDGAISEVERQLPSDFPADIATPIFEMLMKMQQKHRVDQL